MNKCEETELSRKMRMISNNRSDTPNGWLDQADKFDEASAGFFGSPQTVSVEKFLGVYARTRKMFCAYTGDPLV